MRKHTMTKILVAAATMVTLFTTAGFGQIQSRMDFGVPFAFRAAGVILPAGDYHVTPSDAGGILMLHSADGRHTVFVLYNTKRNPGHNSYTYGLTFGRIGSTYILTSLWEPTSFADVRLPKPDNKMLLEARSRKAATATTIMASRR